MTDRPSFVVDASIAGRWYLANPPFEPDYRNISKRWPAPPRPGNVWQRVARMRISEAELEEYVERKLGDLVSGEIPISDRVLAAKIVWNLRVSLARLNGVPASDPIWKGTNGRPTIFKLHDFLRQVLRQDPDDEGARWGLIALALHHCDNDFGRSYLEAPVHQDPRSIMWLVASAAWVANMSGFDTTPLLRESLARLKSVVSNLEHDLGDFALGPDPYLRRMARAALGVLQGQRLVDALPRNNRP